MVGLLFVILAGFAFGSFINALVWRIHKRKNWVSDRSICTHCRHVLAPIDLIPVFSWLMLRGKCRYCGKRIEDTPLPELLLPALYAVSYLLWPLDAGGVGLAALLVWLAILVGLVALFVYDMKWQLLPNGLVAYVTVGALVLAVLDAVSRGWYHLLSAVIGGVVIFGFFWILFQVSGGKWIGGGDVKLAFALGVIAGSPAKALLVVFIASLLGTLVAVPGMLSQKLGKASKVAFGPFLVGATIIVFLWGQKLIDWYINSVLRLG